MKIAYIFTEFPSGQVSNSTRVFSMLDRGHDVTVFASSSGTNLYDEETKKYKDKLKIIYFNKRNTLLKELFSI